jgi:hypothetical protein
MISKSGEEESVNFAYTPAELTNLSPINASDSWTRGVKVYRTHMSSLVLGETAKGVFSTFDEIEESLQTTAQIQEN